MIEVRAAITLTVRVIPDDASRLAALKAGEIHIDMNLPLDAIDAVSGDPNLKGDPIGFRVACRVEQVK